MTAFKAPTDDILATQRLFARAAAASAYDAEISAAVITEFARFAEMEIAPLNQIGDTEGCRLTQGGVEMPPPFRSVYQQLAAAGWQGLGADSDNGGMGLDKLTAAGVSEIFTGACHALQMVCNLVPGAIAILENFGTADQKQRLIPPLAQGRWLSTMCLSEPEAGSDLSAIRCQAQETDGQWRVTGEKIFISGGDQNLSESVLHFVLARTGPPEDGLAALSLFACLKADNNGPGQLAVLRLEDKLGIHASPTCHMRFEGARAELIGSVGSGLGLMFTLMNHARLDVALQGVAHAQRAAHLSHDYAQARIQGRQADRSPARLSDHADIQRMLNEQRVLALGGRAMCYHTLSVLGSGSQAELAEFLTPLCKFFCSQAGIRAADLGIQIMGGYGYLKEYQIEQVWRDARITAIYEGANGIHARAMVTRNLRLGQGQAADSFIEMITTLDSHGVLAGSIESWKHARSVTQASPTPEHYAEDFSQLSAHLFFRALWEDLSARDDGQAVFSAQLAGFVRLLAWPVRADWLAQMALTGTK